MNTDLLVKNCLKNDRQAQKQLYNLYAATMLGLCYRYTKSIHDAEDVLQEGFVKTFHNLHQFKNDGDLGAWIRRIMVNTALNYLQKHSRYKKDLELDNIGLHPVAQDEPMLNINMKDLIELVRKLPLNYQTVFNLVAVEGYNQTEIAEMMQTNVNTIRSQYSRGRSMLLKMMEEEKSRTQKIDSINSNN